MEPIGITFWTSISPPTIVLKTPTAHTEMQIELAEVYRDTAQGREAAALLQPCVQCGQCTFTCPTYRLLDDEWDGPRGRIWLIKQMLEGEDPTPGSLPPAYSLRALAGRSLHDNLRLHLDRCLSCRSCETSCPQEVRYGRLLDIGRELVEHRATRRSPKDRLMRYALRQIAPYRYRFTTLLRTGQILRYLLPPNIRRRIPKRRTAQPWPVRDHRRTMVIWQGCVQPALAPEINAATARVLDRFGIRGVAADAGCCGALSHHLAAGREARHFMRTTINALWPYVESGVEAIVLTASGCGMHLREYGELLRDDALYRDKAARIAGLTKDIAEIVAQEWQTESPHGASADRPVKRIAFQSSCSLQHGEKLNGVAEALLKRAGYKLVPVAYPFMCCGAAGTYSILQRGLSESLRTRKLETLLATRPEAIVTANIGCLTHLALASPIPVKHWIEMLDDCFSHENPSLRRSK